ncbi:hypothetical protein GZ982_26825 [Pseudomonas fluorescens]|nr:hypothetical protein GZ982_26825 [Pseudomonas fluorescens]
MSVNIKNLVVMARLSVQRALLGEVSKTLRAVILSVADQALDIRFYFDGEIEEDDIESVSCVETEILADYDESFKVVVRCVRLDAPEPIADDGIWVFRRREM